ncbi:MAG: TonB-dependent receptor, partial [Bryobacteraceae bacterium]|nr:TonB-dependent receptor [Bryobacteraceae bacterium]
MNPKTLALFLLTAAALNAQSEAGTASIAGTIFDPSGSAIPSAEVVLSNVDTGQTRRVETTSAGLYTAVRLPAGRYTLSIHKTGFQPARSEDIALGVGSALTFDVTLHFGTTTETVTVVADIPAIETGRSQTSTVIDRKAVRDLPINGRNFLDFTILTPGVVRDPRAGDLSFGGQRGPANSLLIDGSDANSAYWGQSTGRAGFRNPYSFSQESVQEFQVIASSFAPEIGRATGGVINVITKSGTNQFHGAAFWFFRDRAMNANTFFNNRAGIKRQPYHFNQFGGNAGGPVKKNRLFFFYNYDGQRNTSPNALFLPVSAPGDAASQAGLAELSPYLRPYTTGLRNDIHTVKADWLATARHSLSFRYNLHRFLGVNFENPGPQSAAGHTGDTTLNTDNVTLAHTWVIGTNKLLDQRFLWLGEYNPSSAAGEGPEVIVRQNGITALSFGQGNFLPRRTEQNKYGLVQTFTWNIGAHNWKFGHDLKFERAINLNTNLFFGQYTFDSFADFANRRPSGFAQALPGPGTSGGTTYPNSSAYALFAQDSWRATSRLTLTYGLRYDLFVYEGNSVRNPDAGLAAAGLRTGVLPTDYGNLAGRLGFAYRIGATGRLLIRGGAGTFYGALAGLVPRTIQAQNGLQVASLTLRGNAMPAYPAVLSSIPEGGTAIPDIYVMQNDFKTSRTHQWSLNVEGQVAPDITLTLGYLGARGTQLTRVRDINQFPHEIVAARYSDATPVTFERRPGVSAPARPNAAFGRISLVESGADSIYHAGFIQATKRYSRGLQVQANYTFSKIIDTAPYATAFIPNSAAEDPNLPKDTLRPNADRGIGDANVSHRFAGSAVWDLTWADRAARPSVRWFLGGWQISTVAALQSGRWYSARSNVDLDNDGNRFTDRSPGYGRNTI